ncbi:MAG: tetratricopeptide repeat protein, partial [Candidatus Rokuibacteriota bacterium]
PQVREAEALARHALRLNPAYDSAYTTLGVILAARHDDKGAEAAFRRATELAPERIPPIVNLGALHARNGRYLEALPLLRKAWAKDPDHPGLRNNLGLALRNYGTDLARARRLAEAVTIFQEAIAVIPDDAELHRNIGLVLWEQGRTEAAGPHLERAATLRPGDESARGLLARFRADPERPLRLR